MTDRERLHALYTSQPENKEQEERKIILIKQLELQLGITKLDDSIMAVNGDLDDLQGFKKA